MNLGRVVEGRPVRVGLLGLALLVQAGACIEGEDPPATTDLKPEATAVFTFTLKGQAKMSILVTPSCTADSKSDCNGDLYWGLYETQVLAPGTSLPYHVGVLKSVKDGSSYQAVGIPIKPKMYMAAFLDDDSNALPLTPLPDSGDPVHVSTNALSAKPGETVDYTILLQALYP